MFEGEDVSFTHTFTQNSKNVIGKPVSKTMAGHAALKSGICSFEEQMFFIQKKIEISTKVPGKYFGAYTLLIFRLSINAVVFTNFDRV